jgi:hypothetical protein
MLMLEHGGHPEVVPVLHGLPIARCQCAKDSHRTGCIGLSATPVHVLAAAGCALVALPCGVEVCCYFGGWPAAWLARPNLCLRRWYTELL